MVEELHAKRRSPTEDSSAQLLTSLDQCLLLLRGVTALTPLPACGRWNIAAASRHMGG